MSVASKSCVENGRPLSLDEYERYGRQMIQSGWGLPGEDADLVLARSLILSQVSCDSGTLG
jgi:hypothetical protein